MIKGTTRVCGLLGNPVAHSISPLIHNTLADRLFTDLVYVAFQVETEGLAAAVAGAYDLNILGLNVTVPHKQEVMKFLVDIDPLAEAIGAVNTLVRTEGGYKGYNTDILGLKRELSEEKVNIRGEEIIILGAGGAARAIAFLCAQEGADHIHILNRTVEKAAGIARAVNKNAGRDVVSAMPVDGYHELSGKKYLVIQTTSVGLHPDDNSTLIEDEAFYDMVHTGVDIIYNPYETKFMRLVKKHGGSAHNGLKMLLYQGIAAFELWNGIVVPEEAAMYVHECMKKELNL